MKTFTPTKHGNPCRICGDISGKCRQTAEGLHLCMTFVNGVAVKGCGYCKPTKDETWGIYAEGDGSNYAQAAADFRPQETLARYKDGLPSEQRHQCYNAILRGLPLHEFDRLDLVRRGLTEEQIELAGFKSVNPRQYLGAAFPLSLPGVREDGRSLNTSAGYLCPIRDVDGLIVGCQIRVRHTNGGRYRWLSSLTDDWQEGFTPHLQTGELPIAVHQPQVKTSSAVGLCEGVGAKPFIAAQKMGCTVIGAAGGQFAFSQNELKRSLDKLQADLILFFPDAGAIINPNVLRQYHKLFQLLKEWQLEIKVAWWGQEDKGADDIDETASEIGYLLLPEFREIALTRAIAEYREIKAIVGDSGFALAGQSCIAILERVAKLKYQHELNQAKAKTLKLMGRLGVNWASALVQSWLGDRTQQALTVHDYHLLKQYLTGLNQVAN